MRLSVMNIHDTLAKTIWISAQLTGPYYITLILWAEF